MMKRIFTVFCTVFMVFSCLVFTGCSKKEEINTGADLTNSEYVGTWGFTKVSFAEEEASTDEVTDGNWTITLKGDGTGESVTSEGTEEITWGETSKGVKIKGEETNLDLVKEDNLLTTKILGVTISFEKQ